MAQTLYASFQDASLAEKAAGALLDHGARNEDISVVTRGGDQQANGDTERRDYTAHGATLEERRTTGSGAYDAENRAANAGGSAWDATRGTGNKIAEGFDRAGAAVSGAVGADNTAANLDAAADERRARAGAEYSQSSGEFGSATGDRYASNTELTNQGATVGDSAATTGYTTDAVYNRNANADSNTTQVDHSTGSGDKTETAAKQGLSTTTPGDAAAGAAKGAAWGLGVGVLAALASLVVPGFGLVVGGGALATAIAGAAGATAAGAIAGGIEGYLVDQGVPDHIAADYNRTIANGGALLSVHVPTGDLDEASARELLSKYGAGNFNTYGDRMAA